MAAPYIPKRMNPADYNRLSPMMKQYLTMRGENEDCLLMFRLGDFYELFFDDAALVSNELGLTLTGKECGLEYRAPMCGVPHHSAARYINQLVKRGYRVAICEQTSDPQNSRGIVERDVVRIVTPGTAFDDDNLDEKQNNFVVSLFFSKNKIGMACADVSVGDFSVSEFDGKNAFRELFDELSRIQPNEVILPQTVGIDSGHLNELRAAYYLHPYSDREYVLSSANRALCTHFHVISLEGFGISNNDSAISAAGALIAYLDETQKNALEHINRIQVSSRGDYMALDDFTRTNLELIKPIRNDGSRSSTLLSILDNTKTAMGGRLIKQWITMPLIKMDAIKARLMAVDELYRLRVAALDELRSILGNISDIERICAKIAYNALTPPQCVALGTSLRSISELVRFLSDAESDELKNTAMGLDPLYDLSEKIRSTVKSDAPTVLRDGEIINDGFDAQIDEYRKITNDSKAYIEALEASERKNTGLKGLRIGYNRVFGYYYEVSKANAGSVPEHYVRQQTLTNAERYYTAELKELEEKLMTAREKCIERELLIYSEVVQAVRDAIPRLQNNARLIAKLDVYASFAQAARKHDYVCPEMNDSGRIAIKNCRHPVVELGLRDGFNPNDILMDNDNNRMLIITGPNMAGKSTYMRQTAIAVLMAHIGCFVPASKAEICLVDRIFTRVGASDSLASGQSTFMVEMVEMASILNNATNKSLLILDEIGRGTATYDGLSIAWAVVEHIAEKTRAKTMFATHYHELVSLENKIQGLRNYSVSVHEVGDHVVFLHKIIPGGSDRSFGIQVAQLAGIPSDVITRAKSILSDIESSARAMGITDRPNSAKQISTDTVRDEIYESIKKIQPDAMTPMEALKFLYSLSSRIKAGASDE